MRKSNQFLSLFMILCLSLIGCSKKEEPNGQEIAKDPDIIRWIGDSQKDDSTDDDNFSVCNGDENIMQYFHGERGAAYPDEKPAFMRKIEKAYKMPQDKSQNGFIRIRFVVNCEGQGGRFRILQSDANYKETKFDKRIVSQLLKITKGIEKWEILHEDSQAADYYFFIVFKITNGQISEILP